MSRFAQLPERHPFQGPLTAAIYWAAENTDRSLQRFIGPSEIGTDCSRELAYKLAETPRVNRGDPWFTVIGTAVHEWLSFALDEYQKQVLGRGKTNPRWLVEQRVRIDHDEFGTSGSTDVLDLDLGEVIDYKVVGNDSMKRYKANGPSEQYRVQAHTYAKGWRQAGRDIRAVTIVFLPRTTFLHGMHIWSEPFDESVADHALSRVGTIRRAVAAGVSPALFPVRLADRAEYCQWCPFLRRGQPASDTGCPGVDG